MIDPRERMERRLQALHTEFERGQQQLALLRQKEQDLQETVLRISGAIQVLEELLAEETVAEGNVAPGGDGQAG